MRRLDYYKIEQLAEDIVDITAGLRLGDECPYCATDSDLRELFVKLALELDYVVKHVPRADTRCPYTIDMAL